VSSYRTVWDREEGDRPTKQAVDEAERHATDMGIIELARLLGVYQARLEALERVVRRLTEATQAGQR
jgi:hypothetical protein